MPDYPGDWLDALEMLARSQEGSTEVLMLAQGFAASTIAGLVDTGLVTSTTERVSADGRTLEVIRLRITGRGWAALER
jgi:hypothetical protein